MSARAAGDARTRASRRSRTRSSTRCSSSAASASARSIVANLLASRLTVLYGASGVGKSSLLRAGVARAAARGARTPTVVVFSIAGRGDPAARSTRRSRPRRRRLARRGAEARRLDGDSTSSSTSSRSTSSTTATRRARARSPTSCPSCSRGRTAASTSCSRIREDALAAARRVQGADPEPARELPAARPPRPRGRRARRSSARSSATTRSPASRARRDRAGARRRRARRGRCRRVELGGVGAAASPTATAARAIEAPYLQLVMSGSGRRARRGLAASCASRRSRGLGGADADRQRPPRARARRAARRREQDAAARDVRPPRHAVGHEDRARASRPRRLRGRRRGELAPVLATLGRERILRPVETAAAAAERYEIFHDVLAEPCSPGGPSGASQRERQDARRHAPPAARRSRLLAGGARGRRRRSPCSRSTERGPGAAHERQATARELEASALLGLSAGRRQPLARAAAAKREPGTASEDVLRQVLVGSRLRALPATGPVELLQFSATGEGARRRRRRRVRMLDDRSGGAYAASAIRPTSPRRPRAGRPGALGRRERRGRLRRLDSARLQPSAATVRSRPSRSARGRLLPRDDRRGGAAVVARPDGTVRMLPQPGPVVRGVLDPAGGSVATSQWKRAAGSVPGPSTSPRARGSTSCRSRRPGRRVQPGRVLLATRATTGRSASGAPTRGGRSGCSTTASPTPRTSPSAPTASCSPPGTATARRGSGRCDVARLYFLPAQRLRRRGRVEPGRPVLADASRPPQRSTG